MQNYLPTDIHSNALRATYYNVQKILSDRYEKLLKMAPDKHTRQIIVENFNREIRETINYYVGLSR